VSTLPIDVPLAVAAAGIDVNFPDERFAAALWSAMAERGGCFDGP